MYQCQELVSELDGMIHLDLDCNVDQELLLDLVMDDMSECLELVKEMDDTLACSVMETDDTSEY
jgi:hypothetical protein